MLVIRAQQMSALEQAGRRRFEDEMVAHARDFTPRLSEVLGEEQLRIAVRSAIGSAEAHGFTLRGPIRLYVELTFLRGGGFETDPQYPKLGAILRQPSGEMQRAELLYEAMLDYLEKVSGPGAVNVHKALSDLLVFARSPLPFSSGFLEGMILEMSRVFPKKAAYIGEAALSALIREGVDEARRYGFATFREAALIVALMFAFGHRCTADPLYPWIQRTLHDPRITDPAARARRLEQKAVTWLEHVVERNRRRG